MGQLVPTEEEFSRSFLLPPEVRREDGELRRAGFEFELTGVGLEKCSAAVQEAFGGEVQHHSRFACVVTGTVAGDFSVVIDTSLLKEKKHESLLRSLGIQLSEGRKASLENSLLDAFSTIVPFEISTPPISFRELWRVERLREILHGYRAVGTRRSLLYAFGLHINIEAPSLDPFYLQDVVRAFILLYPWIKKQVHADVTRRLSPYIMPFPDEYALLVLSEDYPVRGEQFIADYLRFNRTRNRALDMLPLLAMLDHERVMESVNDPALIRPRPAFHYRMPNCLIDERAWTVSREWNTWVVVERLAADRVSLETMAEEYRATTERSFRHFIDRWPRVLEEYVGT